MSISTDLQQFWELLAPYLPYKIQVYHAAHGVGTLVGLPYGQVHERPLAEVHFEGKGCLEYYELSEVKPVLYGWADLINEINGIVPAIELAREFCASEDRDYYTEDFDCATVAQTPDGLLSTVFVVNWTVQEWYYPEPDSEAEEGDTYTGKLIIHPDFTCAEATEDGLISLPPAAFTKLRSLHFAVGLTPDQYVRKGTCLACPTCQQKGACHV